VIEVRCPVRAEAFSKFNQYLTVPVRLSPVSFRIVQSRLVISCI
jgi:hypothetical protein